MKPTKRSLLLALGITIILLMILQVALPQTAAAAEPDITPAISEESMPPHDGSETQGGMISFAGEEEVQSGEAVFSPLASGYTSTYGAYSIQFYTHNSSKLHYTDGRYTASDGRIAYCLNVESHAPQGGSYNLAGEPGLPFYAALLFGYPTFTTIGGYTLSADQAREATQFAIWALGYKIPGNDYIDLSTVSTTSKAGASSVLAAGMWLYNKCSGLQNIPTAGLNLNDYFDMGTLHTPTDSMPVFWDTTAGTLRSGPYYLSSALAGANPVYIPVPGFDTAGLPAYVYYGDENGNPLPRPGFNTNFYLYFNRALMPADGSVNISARIIFRAPSVLVYRPADTSYQNMLQPIDPAQGGGENLIPLSWDTAEVSKIDADTKSPLAGAVFELYAYPVDIINGVITTNIAAIANDDPAWIRVGPAATSDAAGRLDFGVLPYGFYQLVETSAPDGYQNPQESGGQPYLFVLDVENATNPVQIENHQLQTIEVSKADADTHAPIANTEFALYAYPVTIEAGLITTNTASITADDPQWALVATRITDANGRLDFGGLAFGYYQIIETRPNGNYAEYLESGGTARFVRLDEHATRQVQVFEDQAILISCEVFKDTINLTSAAFATDADDYLNVDNTNNETYHYDLDFRSTANVRADEFVVIDPLENAVLGLIRLEELFTPVAWGDTDGLFNLWYQTNLTDRTAIYSTADAMTTNPYNPNNPGNQQVWPSTGWQLWRAALPSDKTTHLFVADLGLQEGEYITGLRFEYGSVELGFTTRNTLSSGLQEQRVGKPTNSDWTPRITDAFYSPQAAAAVGLKPATYLVSCPNSLLPPALIASTAHAYIARNQVLTDQDHDAVQTEVIKPFMLQPNSGKPTDITLLAGYAPPRGLLPRTGDEAAQLLLLGIVGSLLGVGLLIRRNHIPGGGWR